MGLRASGAQNKWSMLKYRVDVEELPYHQSQFSIDEDIDFSYLLPKDHQDYKPASKPRKSEIELMTDEERKNKFPEVREVVWYNLYDTEQKLFLTL